MSGNNYLWLLFDDYLACFIVLLVIFGALPSHAITSQTFQVAATIQFNWIKNTSVGN